ncbi:rRNA methyltransferase 1, mitochondrial-like isoform X2 [Penaeus chinensis]|uniref:rRNA methyltransferase 1, mitochondrial-like isoform X2 n=1 Tax=Penaeus chinensis TaxID=139456 RepID=UPI001FB6D50F|nr:rRNA methyltransferase 1, mitochondrial-like isoform X2 [Penaeus chinensis]
MGMFSQPDSVLQGIFRRASNKSLPMFPRNFRYGFHRDKTEERPRIVSPVSGTDKLQDCIRNEVPEISWRSSYGRLEGSPKQEPCSSKMIKKQTDKVKHRHMKGGDWSKKHLHHKERKKGQSKILKDDIIYGIHPVYLALCAQRRKIHKLYYRKGVEANNSKIDEILDLCHQRNVEMNGLEPSEFGQYLKSDKVHQGIYCKASRLLIEELEEEEILASNLINKTGEGFEIGERKRTSLLWLYLDQIQDPMNFGAILRSAYYFGVDKIITSKEHSCQITGNVSKASAGVAELLTVYQVEDASKLFGFLRKSKWNLLSTATSSTMPVPIRDFEAKENTLLVIGNEGRGVSPHLASLCTNAIFVPSSRELQPGVDSLNVSVAAAIILHSLRNKLNCV